MAGATGTELGGLVEAVATRFFLEELRRRGDTILRWKRKYIDSEEACLLVEAEHEGQRVAYILEVKVKPRWEDVGALLAKKELFETLHPGVPVKPVLAGTYVSGRLASYAEKKNVEIYLF